VEASSGSVDSNLWKS